MTTTTKHRRFIPEIEYYCRNCACVKKLRVGTSRTFGREKIVVCRSDHYFTCQDRRTDDIWERLPFFYFAYDLNN